MKRLNAFWCVRSLFFAYSKRTAFSDLRSLLFFCVKNAVFSRKCDPWSLQYRYYGSKQSTCNTGWSINHWDIRMPPSQQGTVVLKKTTIMTLSTVYTACSMWIMHQKIWCILLNEHWQGLGQHSTTIQTAQCHQNLNNLGNSMPTLSINVSV